MFDKVELLYVKIAKDLCLDILSNEDPSGMKVPSVREYSKKKQVNANTVQKSYQYLDDLGIFVSEKGLGRYVTNDRKQIDKIKKYLIEVELLSVKKIANQFEVKNETIFEWYDDLKVD
ncbi:MAG: GntR family transcriptional regulator [Bacilli bacterium]